MGADEYFRCIESINLELLNLFGRGYVIEHCISTLNLNKKSNLENKTFKIYVTDTLMAIAENTSHFLGHNGMLDYGRTMKSRWYDIINPTEEEPKKEDDRPCEEIATDMWARIRGH